jgi:signal transduction histidine kinase
VPHDALLEGLLPPGAEYLLIDDDAQLGGSANALERYAPVIESEGLPPLDAAGQGLLATEAGPIGFTRFRASPQDASLLVFEPPVAQATPAPEPEAALEPVAASFAEAEEPLLPMGLPPTEAPVQPPPLADDQWVEPLPEAAPGGRGLTSLFDRLMDDRALFAPLRPDEDFRPPAREASVAADAVPTDVPPLPPESQGEEASAVSQANALENAESSAELPDSAVPESAEGALPSTTAEDLEAEERAAELALPAEEPEVAGAAADEAEDVPASVELPEAAEAAPEIAAVEAPAAIEPPPEGPVEPLPTDAEIAAPPADEAPAPAPQLFRIVARHITPISVEVEARAQPPAAIVVPSIEEAEPLVESHIQETEAVLEEPAALPAESPEPAKPEPQLEAEATPEGPAETARPHLLLLAPVGAVPTPRLPAEAGPTAAPAPGETSTPVPAAQPKASEPEGAADEAARPGPDAEAVERVSRYNFDELSRILNDRVGNGTPVPANGPPAAAAGSTALPSATPEGALVTLGGETLVLNRLPLGILVFRDQQVLFANRAITEMTGYESVEALRKAGLGAIFPAVGNEAQEAGPVNHLVQRNGTLVPVTARLQSVSWQGKPALMLSASATEVRTGHEAAVRAFAELVAAQRTDGFIELTRAGIISYASAETGAILGRTEEQLVGRAIAQLVAAESQVPLRAFFERPARFAETARPAITLAGAEPSTEIALFAQGQAGVVSGYFGFVRRGQPSLPALAAPQRDADPALLSRLSLGIRRPLNTVIGFADLIGSAAFGPIDNERYLEYARDIKAAGHEIASLIDELDDFARLRDGRYTARPTDIDLAALLESCVARARAQANAARVLVRSAISERLPRIRADRASLAQAILNLLASAIGETVQDGSVVLSAQTDDEGGVVVNVRDTARPAADIAERFIVFRDGVGRDGEPLGPVRSSVGLALTRALLSVNAATLSVDPVGNGTLFSLTIPPDNVVLAELPQGHPDAGSS